MTKKAKIWWWAALGVLVVIQLIPMDRSNPPVQFEPKWDSPRTAELTKKACYDCHSNETTWPLYSYIAPVSWLVVHDVEEGREHANFSLNQKDKRNESARMVRKGAMPMEIYVMMHSTAKLTDAEREELAKGLEATFGKSTKKFDKNLYNDEKH